MTPLLRTENLTRHYDSDGPAALDNASISLQAGEILGIVGESGSGKSTLTRLVMALDRPSSGTVFFEDRQITALSERQVRPLRRDFQMVFQDPYGSLDPRHTVGRIIGEPLGLEDNAPRGAKRRERITALLEEVGLKPGDIDRYPHQFSGGQRQRIAIARALITRPKLLVADEPTSALDVTVQAQILKLLLTMRADHGLSILLITHDIGVVEEICDRVAVMQQGKIVESGSVREVLDTPQEPYTRRLLSAEPTLARLRRPT
ncbi:ATP-binding cassette domain-containing protein [Martelella radicis]|uniref:Peptide/nickel transport system ATP-binding protein n=1 Tax=Martelella radicis TaxID=1397476 RepID=A0A7W6KIR1_9HYPH|nr:ABC transporter ATP-binding protein [Martelella radicis]MBB4122026.1 peptide/nickel transport system ATP-binding protein [Martelella radicis]